MERENIKERIKNVVANVLKVDEGEISDDANFIFDLGADSMQSMLLIAAFEEEFGIEMDVAKAQEVQTIGGAVDFIAGYI
jgi:acyl carrier protein